jgi:predicted phage baseplate assembly protein
MLQHLGTESALARLTTRSTNDPAIAMLDAWATVADVLTFYQERIANEGFLRTATERQSILELARAIGYELNAGVAANALLEFVVEDAAGAPGQATLDAGLKVSSIPGQNERPQTFETVEKVTVRAEWNVLRPRMTEPQTLDVGATELFVGGLANLLEPGDGLLLLDAARRDHWDFRILRSVEVVPSAGYTRVTWTSPLGETVAPSDDFEVFVFRQRCALFGYNAPDFRAMPDTIKAAFAAGGSASQWPNFEIGAGLHIDLDAVYPRILPDSWVLLTGPDESQLYHADDVVLASRTDYTMSAKVSRLILDTASNLNSFGLRETVVLAQSEQLLLAEQPALQPVGGNSITLDRRVDGLQPGQRLGLTGRPSGGAANAPLVSEAATIDSIVDDGTRTTITLVAPLDNSYDSATLTINANVARATHGESVRNEVLGSGQAGKPNQHFTLLKPPLTHVSAPAPTGTQSTLDVRVDGVKWEDAPSLFGLGPSDQKFTVRIEDDGQTHLIFGDGTMGARLTTGIENVVATYRSGLGLDGNVRAGSLALLQARPLGIRGVSNPLPASGAAAAENLDDARANAPLTVLTLGRIVSLRDFEDFTRAFAGVGKAQATRLWNGRAHFAHITVGGAGGGPIDTVATLPNLLTAIDAVRDPVHEVRVQSYTPRAFGLVAEVLVDERYRPTDVLAAAAAALAEAFSFSKRDFGQAVSAAEVITTAQAVAGVQAVSLSKLFLVEAAGNAGNPPPFLSAAGARWSGTEAQPAELILIDPHSMAVTEMPPQT